MEESLPTTREEHAEAGRPQRRLRFGIKTAPQYTTYDDILRIWREADQVPIFEHAWVFDHLIAVGDDPSGPCLEGWTLLSALAAETERLRVGVMVTSNTFRHPAVLAKMAATVDQISHGRLDFGIGAGWNDLEHSSTGIPLYPASERIAHLGEACEAIQRLWTEDSVDFAGRYYHLDGARCQPKPLQRPRPPIVIGGGGERLTLRVVAQYADIWNIIPASVEEFARKSAILDEHCTAVSRDPETIERSVQVLADLTKLDETRKLLRSYIATGATHLVLELRPPFANEVVIRTANDLIAEWT
jgi:F420-dependent oxidoreductase-like protein